MPQRQARLGATAPPCFSPAALARHHAARRVVAVDGEAEEYGQREQRPAERRKVEAAVAVPTTKAASTRISGASARSPDHEFLRARLGASAFIDRYL